MKWQKKSKSTTKNNSLNYNFCLILDFSSSSFSQLYSFDFKKLQFWFNSWFYILNKCVKFKVLLYHLKKKINITILTKITIFIKE